MNGRTAIEGLSVGSGDGAEAGPDADVPGVDRLVNGFDRLRAHFLEFEVEPGADLAVDVVGDADAAGLGQAFEPGRDVDPVAVDVVALDDHVAPIESDAKGHAAVLVLVPVPCRHPFLHRDRALDRIKDAGEVGQLAVAGGLDDAPVRPGGSEIDQLGAVGHKARQCPRLVALISRE